MIGVVPRIAENPLETTTQIVFFEAIERKAAQISPGPLL